MAKLNINREGSDTVFYTNVAGVPAEVMRVDQAGNVTMPASLGLAVPQVSDPSAPATGAIIYFQSASNKLYSIKAGGTPEPIGSGGGGGSAPVTALLLNGYSELSSVATLKVAEGYDTLGGVIVEEKWSMTGSTSSSRYGMAAAGNQNSALVFGGFVSVIIGTTDKFNGFVWSNTSSLATPRQYFGGAGMQHAALAFGGNLGMPTVTGVTEKFNGLVWSGTGAMTVPRTEHSGAGNQNAALGIAGYTTVAIATCEKFNGSVWSSTGSTNESKRGPGGAGSQNAALSFGGHNPPSTANTEKFNGSVWSYSGLLNVPRKPYGTGTQNSALSAAGYNGGGLATAEKFNGSVWSLTSSVNTVRWDGAMAGTQNAALIMCGVTATCEKFIGTLTARMNIWARGTNESRIGTAQLAVGADAAYDVAVELDLVEPVDLSEQSALNERGRFTNLTTLEITTSLLALNMSVRSFGFKNAVIAAGGFGAVGGMSTTQAFNGSIWSVGASLTQTRALHGAVGMMMAGLVFGGNQPSVNATSEKFNGTAWTSTVSMNTARANFGCAGVQGAAHVWRGGAVTTAEIFNGTAWSAAPNPPASSGDGSGGCGTRYASLSMGGASSVTAVTEKFNGASWSTVSPLNIARGNVGVAGHQGSALVMAGLITAATNVSETYNGSVWFSSGDSLLVARHMLAGSGTAGNALFAGGGDVGGNALDGVERTLPIGGGLVGLTNRFYTRLT